MMILIFFGSCDQRVLKPLPGEWENDGVTAELACSACSRNSARDALAAGVPMVGAPHRADGPFDGRRYRRRRHLAAVSHR
jgi:hypothetical protein